MSHDHATLATVRAISLLPLLHRLAFVVLALAIVAGCSGGGGGGGTSAAVIPPPVAAADNYSTGTGQATLNVSSPGVLTNDTGTGLTAEIVGSPAHAASFTLNPDGSFTYVHDNTSAGTTDSFTYRATNSGGTSTATVTITIVPPVAAGDTYSIAVPSGTLNAPIPGVLANDTGTGLTAELLSSPAHFSSFTLNPNGSFTYVHDGSIASTDSFTYRAKVGAIVSNTVTVTININQPPVASNFCATTPAGQNLTVSLSGHVTDPNAGDTVTCEPGSLVTPLKGTVSSAGGVCTYMPRVNLTTVDGKARGVDKFSIRAVDSQGLRSNEVVVTVLIDGAVRVMPLGDSITQGIIQNGTCDPDGDCPARSQRIGYRKKLWTDLEALSPSYAVDFVGTLADGGSLITPPDDQHEGRPGDCATSNLNSWCALPDVYDSSIKRNLADNVIGWLNKNQADAILLHVGTNGLNFTTPSANANAVDSLLGIIDSWAAANYPVTVFVARIIPTVDGSMDVNTFNSLVAGIPPANHPHVQVIMVDEQSQLRLTNDPNKADPSLMGSNLHPNQTGYDKMADKWRLDMISSGVLPNCP